MPALKRFAERDDQPHEDHIVVLDGVSWADYLRILRIRGDRSGPRLTYWEGLLQIMSPSFNHELICSLIGRLVETYCLDEDIDFTAAGSWTLKERRDQRGAEPDECYVFGPGRPRRPHLAIEVVWTAGGLDKLDVYRKLGVAEVWIWERGQIQVHVLRGDTYRKVSRSKALPDLDLDLLCQFLDRPSTARAIRDFRTALVRRRKRP